MQDTMLEEIWRVRDELVKRHGGVHGYLKHLRALDKERQQRMKRGRIGRSIELAAKNGRRTRRQSTKP